MAFQLSNAMLLLFFHHHHHQKINKIVGLMGHDTNYMTQKFIGFQLLVEPKDPSPDSDVGQFQLYGDTLTKVSDNCPTAISHTSTIPKHEIQVM